MEGTLMNSPNIIYLMIAQMILILILAIVVVVCIVKIRQLYRRYDLFMRGKDAESMEEMIINQMTEIKVGS